MKTCNGETFRKQVDTKEQVICGASRGQMQTPKRRFLVMRKYLMGIVLVGVECYADRAKL